MITARANSMFNVISESVAKSDEKIIWKCFNSKEIVLITENLPFDENYNELEEKYENESERK